MTMILAMSASTTSGWILSATIATVLLSVGSALATALTVSSTLTLTPSFDGTISGEPEATLMLTLVGCLSTFWATFVTQFVNLALLQVTITGTSLFTPEPTSLRVILSRAG